MKRAKTIHRVVFVRHDESTWNNKNRFTGWHDVHLSATGFKEAVDSGKMLRDNQLTFDEKKLVRSIIPVVMPGIHCIYGLIIAI